MPLDRSFVEENWASVQRMKDMAARLTDEQLRHPVGQHWTVAIVFAHIAFWDRRAMNVLDSTEREGKVVNPAIDTFVNDISLPLWAAIPPRDAVRIAIENAEALNARLEAFPADLLEALHAIYPRYVYRSRHRGEHLDEADAALNG